MWTEGKHWFFTIASRHFFLKKTSYILEEPDPAQINVRELSKQYHCHDRDVGYGFVRSPICEWK
jgi:hypothetical protein